MVAAAALLCLANGTVAHAGPKTHRVAKGQTLGKIASRYNVSVDALRAANGIVRKQVIKPGQRLWIPPKDDPDGSKTAALRGKQDDARGDAPRHDKRGKAKRGGPPPKTPVRWHTVANKQRLGSIAKRYNVTLAALQHANDIGPKSVIKPGEKLIIPGRHDVDGSEARAQRQSLVEAAPAGDAPSPKGAPSWAAYQRAPARPGWVKVFGRKDRKWEGRALTKSGRASKKAKAAFARVLATRSGQDHAIDPRLIELVARVSDTFGGREIRVVSGYRLGDTPKSSRHRHGRAIDFVVAGVPNAVVRDYVKTFDAVGVGYYPNSHFVHLDVRERWTYWVDLSAPGQPARYTGMHTRRSKPER